jgi:hypothetical protein
MPMKRQAIKIKSSVKSASKGSVKAKKAVSTSGYGYGSCEKKTGYGSSKKKWYGSSKKKSGYGCKKNSGYGGKQEKSDHGCKHVKSDCGCTPVKKVCKPVKYVCKPVKSVSKKTCKRAAVARRSAFRAVSAAPQAVAAIAGTQVIFGLEQFDLGGEYSPLTSTFRPRQNGIYTFVASVFFTATELADTPIVFLTITVNNNVVAAETATLASRQVTLDVTTIVRLRSGDAVRVEFGTNQAGVISFGQVTHFEGVLNRVTN